VIERLLPLCTFPEPGTAVAVAVSGGPDSLALLLLAHAHGLDVVAHHVDHGLRPESATDLDVVIAAAAPLGVPVVAHRVSVAQGPNLEARARAARYGAMPDGIATGHTADDQAETVLINLLRGAGTAGLAAMRPGPRHPILALRRRDTEALCASAGLDPVRDTTNMYAGHLRNRIRHEVMPLLDEIADRDVAALLARTATVLRHDDDVLDALARAIDPTDARALAEADPALSARAIRRWLADPYPPDIATIERVMAVARGETTGCDVGGMRQIRRSKQRLSLVKLG
jgi:tRNA(Ile)-lysidine synthase